MIAVMYLTTAGAGPDQHLESEALAPKGCSPGSTPRCSRTPNLVLLLAKPFGLVADLPIQLPQSRIRHGLGEIRVAGHALTDRSSTPITAALRHRRPARRTRPQVGLTGPRGQQADGSKMGATRLLAVEPLL